MTGSGNWALGGEKAVNFFFQSKGLGFLELPYWWQFEPDKGPGTKVTMIIDLGNLPGNRSCSVE